MVTVGVVQAAEVSKYWLVDTVSDSAPREARHDGIVVVGGERNVTTGSIGCPSVDGVNVGKSNSMSVKTGKESPLYMG